MPVDASIPLQVQNPQINLADIYQNAMALRQMRQQMQTQNALKALLTQPDAIDPKTGQPTSATIAKITRLDPTTGIKLSSEVSQTAEREAQTEHAQSETRKNQRESDLDFLSGAVADYDDEVKGGNTAPDIALTQLKQRTHDYIYENYPQKQADAVWAHYSNLDGAGFRNATLTAQQRFEQEKQQETLTEERVPATMGDKPVLVDKEGAVYDPNSGAKIPVTAPIIKQEPGFNPQAADARAQDHPQLLQDKDGTNYWAFPPSPNHPPRYTDMSGNPYTPQGAAHIASGAPRSAAAMATQRYMQEHPNATADEIAQFSGAYNREVTAGSASAKADTGSLTNITKIADASEAFENTAMKNFDQALRLAPKGIKTDMGPLIERWVQDPTKAMGDPGVPAYQAALLTAANEYAKVIAGSTGSQGSTVDSRREAAEMFSSLYNTDQIQSVIGVAKQDMDNKIASYAGQRQAIQERLHGESHGGIEGEPAPVPKGAAPPAPPHEITATGPGGHKIVLRNGKWVDQQTGKPL